jgi:hypothetical protein
MSKQSPKQPQLVGLPVAYVYPVRNVKNRISSNNNQLNSLILHPSNKAKPAIISNAFMNTDMIRVIEYNCITPHISKYSCIL